MADVIDDLKVQIDARTTEADAKIDRFIQKMLQLQSAISGVEMSGAGQLASGINQLASSIQNFSERTKTADFSRVTRGLNKLAGVDVQGVNNASRAMSTLSANLSSMGTISFDSQGILNIANSIAQLGRKTVTQAAQNIPLLKNSLQSFISTMNGLQAISFDASGLTALTNSITKLGGKSASNAIPNIQLLGTALSQLMTTLSNAPAVSQNLIQMTNALANLAGHGSRVSSASRSLSASLNTYSYSANRATKSTKGLVSQIGMFYAKCFLLIRGVKSLWKATKSSMDYIETLNYFDAAWGQVAEKAAGMWKAAGYDSAESYARSFEQRSRELTGKLSGFQPDANGNLKSTGMPSLGLNPERTMNYQATFGQMASSMGVASETALQLSNALTMIGADLASVKNLEFEDVWDDMASGMVGMSRTLDKYGVNIRNVNMQEKLSELGIKTKIVTLNQQDKALLRTIILLQSTKYAWGDLATTIGQPANQLRLLQSNFANLARTIGGLFLPIVSKVLPYINALVIALQRLFSWIGGLLGIKIGGFSSSIGSAAAGFGDMEDAAGGIADSTGDAAKNTKKMAENLQGFDKLNVVTSQNSSGGGGGAGGGAGGAGGLLDDAFADVFAEYQAAWDAAFANMENSAQEMADRIEDAFSRVWEAAEPTRQALKRLWEEGLSQLGTFTWTALKDFWSGFLVPVGEWTLGTGLPMLIDNLNNFLLKIDFPAINEALRNFWQALTPFTTKVGQGLIDFFGDLLSFGAGFINTTVPKGLNSIAEALKKINPDTAEKIGYALGIVATGIMSFKTIGSAVKGIKTIYAPLQKLFKLVGPFKYLAIAAGITGFIVALDKFGIINVNWASLSNGFEKMASALGKFVKGIGEGLINFIKGITPIVSPALEGLINGIGSAFEFVAKVLNSIPVTLISGLTTAFLSFFTAFKTYEMVVKAGGLLQTFSNNLQLFGSVLPGIVNSGPILKNLALALGPTALGAIQFTAIAGGLLLIAQHIMRVTDEAAKNSAIGQFSQALGTLSDEVSQKTAQINSSLENTRNAIETAGVAETQVARDLATEYNTLSSKASLSADEKERLKRVSKELVDIIPGLNGYINEETGYLDIQKESLDAVVQGYESLAHQQAAQEYLVQAYKDQYEAQMNVNNALDSYNKAFDDYITQAGIAPSVIKKIKDNQLDLNQAELDFQNSPFDFEKKYGVSDLATLKKAVKGLNKEIEGYKAVLDDAYKTQENANANLEAMKNTISETEEEIKIATETEMAGRLASEEYKQSLSDLTTVFEDLGLSLSDELMQSLALDNFDPTILDDFFASLAEGTQVSGNELKTAFEQLGLSLPDELAKAMAKQEPNIQAETTKILMKIQSGVAADGPQLKTLFQNLGYELPDAIINNLASKETSVQIATINLLAKIENGHKLTEGNLKKVFATLGINLPEELIKSLAGKDADVQAQVIELLGKIKDAEEGERQPLIDKFNALGVGIADEGVIKALVDKQGETTKATSTFVNEGIKKPLEAETGNIRVQGENIGKNIVDGTNAGIEKNQGSTKSVIGTWVSNITGWFKNALGIASPSKVFMKFGGFSVEGFNNGVLNDMNSSYALMKAWSEGVSNAFEIPNIAFLNSRGSYTLNHEVLDMIDTTAHLSFDSNQYNFKAGITTELQTALSEIIDYERLGEAVYKAQSKALQENPHKIGDEDIFNAARRAQIKYYKRTNNPGFSF